MSEILIKCPTCGKLLRIKETVKLFICPVCKEKHRVGNCQRIQKKPQKDIEATQYGTSQSNTSGSGEETQYEPNGSGAVEETRVANAPVNVGYLVDSAGRRYQLSKGVNTIGRKAMTSNATVQVDDPNGYMSRNHASIEVRERGNQLLYIMKNTLNKNPSYVNGNLVNEGDQLILNHGDRLKLGFNELTFKTK